MKGVLVIIDGLGDRSCRILNGGTPLESAVKPNLDFFSEHGKLGFMYPIKPGFVPSTSNSILNFFGNEFDISRGQLEARGINAKISDGDLVFRANFATIDNLENLNVIDRRAGRTLTTAEAKILASEINKKVKLEADFEFIPTEQHRGVLIFRGKFSDKITSIDLKNKKSGYLNKKFFLSKPLNNDEKSRQSAELVNNFVRQSFEILNKSYINEIRRKKGLMPANFIALRGAGSKIPKLKKYPNWSLMVYTPISVGFSELSEMKIFTFKYPEMKNYDAYENLYSGLNLAIKNAIKAVKKSREDYIYIHFKETDLPGHDNKPLVKKEMIEIFDRKFFSFLKDFVAKNEIKIVVTADHSTVCQLKDHTADAVPVLFYDNSPSIKKEFNEKNAKKGALGKILGKDLLKKVGFK